MARIKRVDDGVNSFTSACLIKAEQGKGFLAQNRILASFKTAALASAQETLSEIEVKFL